MNDFEDIEQLLKPQCEFKASDTLKQKVMEKARQEVKPRCIVRMWPWLAAACVVGFMVLFLTPPITTTKEIPLVAERVETTNEREQSGTCSSYAERGGVGQRQTTKPAEESKQVVSTPEPVIVNVETPRRQKVKSPRKVVKDEPKEDHVEMSEETRLQLLLASLSDDVPKREETDTYDEIRLIRMRGEKLISMYEENDK